VRELIVVAAWALAAPALAQTPAVAQVDAAAIHRFDPDGGSGVPLTKDVVRGYLTAPVTPPTDQEYRSAGARAHTAETARRVLLANETLFAPLWKEQAFELQDGSVRPMTADEKAVFSEVDAADAALATLNARRALADYSDSERAALADALCLLLDAGVRITDRSDGYRKDGDDWLWFDWEDGVIISSRKPEPQAEIALLRYELMQQRIDSAVAFRRRPKLSIKAIGGPF
jgi:hypothetical protein